MLSVITKTWLFIVVCSFSSCANETRNSFKSSDLFFSENPIGEALPFTNRISLFEKHKQRFLDTEFIFDFVKPYHFVSNGFHRIQFGSCDIVAMELAVKRSRAPPSCIHS